jgi:site-specific DNA recombinase
MAPVRKRPVRRVAVYARQSRLKDSLSVPMQLRRCQETAAAEGWQVAAEYTDRGKSGYAPDVRREGYEEMIADLEAGKVDGVLVYKADRLGRDDRERRRIEDLFQKHGLWLVATVTGGRYDLTKSDGISEFRAAINAAEHYSRQLSERMRDHHQMLADEGKDSGGERPFGFEPDRVTIREPEAEMIRDAARRVIGGESLRSICARWNAEGRRTARGSAWRPTRVRRMLMAPRYTGLREHDGETTNAVWPAILDRSTFDHVGAILADPTRKTADSSARRRLLTGFVFCAECSARLYTFRSGNGVRAYRCAAGPNNGGCGRVSVNMELLDRFVSEQAYIRYEQLLMEQAAEPRPSDPSDEAAEELAAIEERLRDLGTRYAAGDIEMEAFVEASKGLRARRDELGAKAAAPVPRPAGDFSRLYAEAMTAKAPWEDDFDPAHLDDWRDMLSAVLTRVEVRSANRGGGKFKPDRVSIKWR